MRSGLRTFGDIAEFRNGVNFLVDDQGEVAKIIGVGDFKDRTEISAFDQLSEIRLRSTLSPDDQLQDGDLLFVRSNGSKNLVGRCVVIKNPPAGVTFSGFTIRARLDRSAVLPDYIALIFQGGGLNRQLGLSGGGNGNISNLNQTMLSSMNLGLPSIELQRNIVDTASLWNAAIEKTERLIAAKDRRLNFLRENTLQHPKQSKKVKLNTVTREATARNGQRFGRDAIMAVTKLVGMRPMREDTVAASTERYKVVKPRAFAYNPMRLNIGSIAMSLFEEDVLVSPDYVVFECDESRLMPRYLNHLRFSSQWRNYFDTAGNGSVRVRIYYDDLGAFTFYLPPLEVQKRVVNVLDAAMLELEKLRRYSDALQKQKRGLMQKLLTCQWRIKMPETETA